MGEENSEIEDYAVLFCVIFIGSLMVGIISHANINGDALNKPIMDMSQEEIKIYEPYPNKVFMGNSDFIGESDFRIVIDLKIEENDVVQDVLQIGDSFGEWVSLTMRTYRDDDSLWVQMDDAETTVSHSYIEVIKNVSYGEYHLYDLKFYRIGEFWWYEFIMDGNETNKGIISYGNFSRHGFPIMLGRCYERVDYGGYCGASSYRFRGGDIRSLEIYNSDFSKPNITLEDFEDVVM